MKSCVNWNDPDEEHDDIIQAACIDGTQKYRDALIEAKHLKGLTTNELERKEFYDALAELKESYKLFNHEAKRFMEERQLLEIERNRVRLMQLEVSDGPAPRRPPPLARIANMIAREHGVTVEELKSCRKTTDLMLARHEAFYLARKYTTLSYPQIGRFFNKDHSTVINGVKRHEERMEAV